MLKGVCIPDTVRIEYKYFFAFLIAEDHLRVECVDVKHKGSREGISLNLLKVFNIYSVSDYWSEVRSFVENNLLSVGQEFSMEAEELHSR